MFGQNRKNHVRRNYKKASAVEFELYDGENSGVGDDLADVGQKLFNFQGEG